MKKSRGPVSIALILIILVLGIVLKNNRSRHRDREQPRQEQVEADPKKAGDTTNHHQRRVIHPPSDEPVRDIGFNRRTSKLIITKHARCRMACRHIDESEVQEILERGIINDQKSEPAGRPDPKYALEGRTHDGQQVRIIFAPTDRGMVVITVIDLDTNWTCDCK